MSEASPAVFIMGPTAAGKTALAMALAERFDGAIISVDSTLVYRGMDIGTAKPDAGELARHPHALVDIRDPSEPYNAALFRRDALQAMAQMREAGRLPILVGGTGLYFRALEQGLDPVPEVDPRLRARLAQEAREQGLPAMHARLAERDADSAARLHPNDTQRVLRALELLESGGQGFGSRRRAGGGQTLPYRVLKLGLMPVDRQALYRDIEARFTQMLAVGLVDEVRALWERGDLGPELPALRAVGYRQVWGFLGGEYDYPEMVRRAVVASRRYAKRQYTWLRAESDLQILSGRGNDNLTVAVKLLRRHLGWCGDRPPAAPRLD